MIVPAPTMGHMIQTTHDLVPADMWPLIDNIVCVSISVSITCPVTMWDSAPPDTKYRDSGPSGAIIILFANH